MEQAEHSPIYCACCDIVISWAPVLIDSKTYCCQGCARGGPCSCDYSQHDVSKAITPEGQILGQQAALHRKGLVRMAKIRPLGDRVVVKPAPKEEVTKSGIVIPDTAKEKPQEGSVVYVGSGRLLDNGNRVPLDLKVGDRVLFAKYGGTEFKLDGEEYIVLKESDILAVVG